MSASTQQVAVVTGSGRQRVGNVIARSLGEAGYAIALHYHRSAEAAETSVQELRSIGVTTEKFQADVTSASQVEQLFDSIEEIFGRLDVLVTTAAIWESIPLDELTAEDVQRNFNVNALGTFLCARRAGLQMVSQDTGGAIITLGDWAIERPYLNHAAYFISKGSIPTLTRALAVELAHRNPKVRVNCIHPGPVMFPPDCADDERQELVDSTLVKHAGDPRVVADAVRFLIDNQFVTGVCLPVDGGRRIYAGEATSRRRPF